MNNINLKEKYENELCRIRNLLEEQNSQVNWGPIITLLSVLIGMIVYMPNFGGFIGIILLCLSFIIFSFGKKQKNYKGLITTIVKIFIVGGVIILILSLYSDFYNMLRQPLDITKGNDYLLKNLNEICK